MCFMTKLKKKVNSKFFSDLIKVHSKTSQVLWNEIISNSYRGQFKLSNTQVQTGLLQNN